MTTPFWLWVSVGCAICALFGFSVVRLGARRLGTETWYTGELAQRELPSPRPVVLAVPVVDLDTPAVTAVHPLPERPERPKRPERPARPTATTPTATRPEAAQAPSPAPTSDRPNAQKLALWARQVKAGERKMSIATDGCRVTWNRTCKHGHPSWLVHLGYLKRHHQLPRHNPR